MGLGLRAAHAAGLARLWRRSCRRRSPPARRSRAAALQVSAFQIPSSKWWLKVKAPPNVIHISSVQQLVDAMVGAEP